ncbi:MAG: LacI family DNA-binding transcriptional regulator [Chloroflexi bacterium]|nr:LacI family DNA-binding transcriptional regulator [Chloroflexota bacterium]
MNKNSRLTIRDVAKQAGVSHQTVSRVINADATVTLETRGKVEAAIAELGFQPNAIARSLANGRTRTLACIAPNMTDYTFARIIEGAEVESRQRGYFLISSSAPDEATFAALVNELVPSRRIEGVMIINPYVDERVAALPSNFPAVFVGAQTRQGADIDSVALDDEAAARVATEHLIELGHRRIAMITGPLIEDCTRDRIIGYHAALMAAGLPVDAELTVAGDWSASSGHAAFAQLVDRAAPPTAIFAQNDRMALGALRAARDRGLTVPDHIAVIGIDDMPLASYFDPPLTTMRQDMFAIGRTAAQLLVRAIDQPQAVRQRVRIRAELLVRQSTCQTTPTDGSEPIRRPDAR